MKTLALLRQTVPTEVFAAWADEAHEWCELACNLSPDKVPVRCWLQWWRDGMTAPDAGALAAKLIS